MIKHIESKEQFENAIKQGVVLVDFFATWCGPCRMLSPVLEEIDDEKLTGASIVKVDVDLKGNLEVARHFGITSIPTLILFKDGKAVKKSLGYMAKDDLVNFIKN